MPKKISKGPTIGFDPVLDLPGLIWSLVQAKLEKNFRAISYDRSGYDWSEETLNKKK